MDQSSNRRTFLKVLGGATAAAAVTHPVFDALADPPDGQDDFFILIHASGAWDVTLSLDPRNERRGLIEPGSTDTVDTGPIRLWRDAPLDADSQTFEPVRPMGSNITFGPAIGNLSELASRLTIFNGLAVNTVSHPDGTFFASTGRHLAGGKPIAASIDTMLANEFGQQQIFPTVSVNFPSTFIGRELDARVSPLRIATVDTVSRVIGRSNANTLAEDRQAVTTLLTQEAQDMVNRAWYRDALQGFQLQFGSLQRMLSGNVAQVFNTQSLQMAQPGMPFTNRQQTRAPINAAFAVEAMKRNLARCVSFGTASHDTHNANYRNQALIQQELFDTLAALVRALDAAPHPTRMGRRLGDHTHILVVSEFCRTPQINQTLGRDHYPNGSALVISPRFRGNMVYGSSDADQLLPSGRYMFGDGMRTPAPPDVLATLLGAFNVDPRKYMRDGEVIKEILV